MEFPLLFNIQNEGQSAMLQTNLDAAAAANRSINTSDPDYEVRTVLFDLNHSTPRLQTLDPKTLNSLLTAKFTVYSTCLRLFCTWIALLCRYGVQECSTAV